MEEIIRINYNWDTSDYPKISSKLKRKLKKHSEERIFEMRKEGYSSGELVYDANKIVAYGWWSFSYCD